MKKSLTLLLIMGSIFPFAFEKMEGPFNLSVLGGLADTYNIQVDTLYKVENSVSITGEHMTFFYHRPTGYLLWSALDIRRQSFFDLPRIQLQAFNPFLIKKELKMSHEGGYKRHSVQDIYKEFNKLTDEYYRTEDEKFLKGRTFLSKDKVFTTSSGVTINNEDTKVTLSKDGKTVDFKQALIKYLPVFPDTTDTIKQAVIESKFSDNSEKSSQGVNTYIIRDVANEKFNKSGRKLLENSINIAVLAIVKGDANKESIICGVATDRASEENFYWISEVKEGISILVDQYSN